MTDRVPVYVIDDAGRRFRVLDVRYAPEAPAGRRHPKYDPPDPRAVCRYFVTADRRVAVFLFGGLPPREDKADLRPETLRAQLRRAYGGGRRGGTDGRSGLAPLPPDVVVALESRARTEAPPPRSGRLDGRR